MNPTPTPDPLQGIERDQAVRILELLAAGNRFEQAARDARKEVGRLKSTLYGISRGGLDVLQERREQRTKWGWTEEHDDLHVKGEIAAAAACYAVADLSQLIGSELPTIHDEIWPWERGQFARKEHRRNLVVAAALLIAELNRLDRAEPKP